MPFLYWIFVALLLMLTGGVGYGVYTTNQLLRTWQPDRNLLLLPGENALRLLLVAVCLLLGLTSGLPRNQLGWIIKPFTQQLLIGGLCGSGLALFFYATTRWIIQRSGRRFYSTVVIQAIVPHNQRELLLVSLAMIPVVLLEELLFRSLLIGGLTPLVPAMVLVVVGGLAFGMLHVPQGTWGIIGATVAGIGLGLLFVSQNSLLAPLVAHYMANLVQVVLAMRLAAFGRSRHVARSGEF